MDVEERARAAKGLRDDEAFKFFIEEVREQAIQAFATSGKDQQAVREEAHSVLRAITKIVGTLDAAVAAQTNIEKRRKKHVRENDR